MLRQPPWKLIPAKRRSIVRGGLSTRGFRARGRILASHVPASRVSGSPVAGALGNELVNTGGSAVAYVYLHYLRTRLGVR
jgi:hypothetical protein